MKKITYQRKLYLDRKSIRALRFLTAMNVSQRALPRKKGGFRVAKNKNIVAPEKFMSSENEWRCQLFVFFKAVEKALSDGGKVKIDFEKVKELHSCGMLIFMARLELWLERYPSKLSCNYPKNEVVEQLFQHVDILRRLGLSSRKEIDSENVIFWHFHSGSKADPSGFKKLTQSVIDKINHPKKYYSLIA
jgi:hypothetical protein